MESVYTIVIFAALLLVIAVPYWRRVQLHKSDAAKKFEKHAKDGLLTPVTLHPHIDQTDCIGCASCVSVCPEDVLGIVGGRATIINGVKCVGHTLCADVCPVGAITMGFGVPRQGMEIPYYTVSYESNVKGLYIVGELSGVGLIKNAISQAIVAVEDTVKRGSKRPADGYDVVIVGAGPAGIAGALACQAKGLRYIVLEQDEIGGTVLHYPRQKLVLTSPVELPLYGKLKVSEITKEELLTLWKTIVGRFNLNVATHQKVDSVTKAGETFATTAQSKTFVSSTVMLAVGRRGSPRKLGVPGEGLPKVMYRLIEAETYRQKKALVVGGGDSAVEAAVALARQPGNTVTLSYRREDFVRLKEKNEQHVKECINAGKIKAVFNSNVREITPSEVIVQEGEKILHNLPNDYVFVFAGGELPSALLKKIGVQLRTEATEIKAA